ncbi:hypothetical protein [Deinococcus sp.]|uniref:hypothetical protein n=1 Tax=Deinococcus sp. TaxID=47478 RepID=UPI003C7D382A
MISISGLTDLPSLEDAGAVISIHDPGEGRPQELGGLSLPVLDLVFHDAENDGDALDHLPERWHLEQVARFLAGLPTQAPDFSLHVYCYAGVSRSTAVASFVLASLAPRLTDAQIVRQVLAVRPQAVPNQLLLTHADEQLGRRLHRAWGKQASRYS